MVEVTREDRLLVADILDKVSDLLDHTGIGQVADLIRDGEYDEHDCVVIATHHRVAAENAALEEAAKVAAWQPIETAPFDQMILLHCPHTDPKTSVGCCAEDCGWLIVEYDMMGSNCEPTHWMPIPKGPTDEH